jgi:TatD DNase family protein
MLFVDTHSHLYLEQFNADRSSVVNRAIESGVKYMLLPNIDAESYSALKELNLSFPKNCLPMMGLHPGSVKENYLDELNFVEKELFSNKFVAVGEIGIDLYWDKTFFSFQQEAFIRQINWALELNLPIVIHARDSYSEIFEILEKEWKTNLKGVFHSFTGTANDAQKIVEMGFYLGIGGIFTFKNSALSEIIKKIDISRLILETDSPYLAPTPKRGQRNESAFLPFVAQKLAEVKQLSLAEVAQLTSLNAFELFSLHKFLQNE